MSHAYALRWIGGRTPTLVDGSSLSPERLCALPIDEVSKLPLRIGRDTVELGTLFTVTKVAGMNRLVMQDAPPLDRSGSLMRAGELIIEGDAGDDLGASMTGGLIQVRGDAGHRVGGPDVTSRRGMTGGEIVIDGKTGDYAGILMRRGLVAIAGETGKSPGHRMLAGTIVLGSRCEDRPGLAMQRGTIIGLDTVRPPASFTMAGDLAASALPAMMMVLRRLRSLQWRGVDASTFDWGRVKDGAWRLWSGDGLTLNKGEVLQWLC